MSYTITTKQLRVDVEFDIERKRTEVLGRWTADTLFDAKEECVSVVAYVDSLLPWRDAIDALPESGGTIGPMPNGVVIEVKRS